MRPSSRIERDRERRISDLVRAGEEVFFEKGYHNTSIEDIARKADYAVGTVYRYFESKEHLFEELLYRKMEAYARHMEAVFCQMLPPQQKITVAIRAKLDFFEGERRFFRLFVEEIAPMGGGAHTVLVSQRCLNLREKCIAHWSKLLRQGMRGGVFKKLDTLKTVHALEGGMHEVIREHVLRNPRMPLRDLEPFLCEFASSVVTERNP